MPATRRGTAAAARPARSALAVAGLVAAATGLWAAFGSPPPIAAHSETIEGDPAPGDVRPTSPGAVTLRFTGPLGPDSRIAVVDDAFHDVTVGATAVAKADPRGMTVALPSNLPDGAYTVHWTAVDAVDGHRTSGSYTFRVGGGAADRPPATGAQLAILVAIATALLTGGLAVRRSSLAVAVALAIGLASAACGAAGPAAPTAGGRPGGTPDGPAAATNAPADTEGAADSGAADDPNAVPIQVAIAASDLAVGEERFSFAILDVNNALIPNVDAAATFFRLEGDGATETSRSPATYYASTLPEAGTYVAHTTFDRAGPWGVAISGTLPDGRPVAPNRVRFEVASRPKSPAVGDAAPATANRTLRTVPDIAALTSDPMPDRELYAMTVDEAVKSGKPTVVVFATPGYCQSRICGPVLDEIKSVAADWRDRVNFIHIEVYKSFSPLVLTDEMAIWGLETEPWTFVLTRDGHVAARLEGNATKAELAPLLERVVRTD